MRAHVLQGGTGSRGERSRSTLAKIVRGIANGDVRRHLMAQRMRDGNSDLLNMISMLQAEVDTLRHAVASCRCRLGGGLGGDKVGPAGVGVSCQRNGRHQGVMDGWMCAVWCSCVRLGTCRQLL